MRSWGNAVHSVVVCHQASELEGLEGQWSGPGAPRTVVKTEQAIIAPLDAAVRQHLLQQTTEKLFGTHRRVCARRSGRFLVLASAVALLQRADAMMAHGDPQEVRSTRAEGGRAMTDGLRVHTPVCVPSLRVDEGEAVGCVQSIAARGTAEEGERRDVDEARGA